MTSLFKAHKGSIAFIVALAISSLGLAAQLKHNGIKVKPGKANNGMTALMQEAQNGNTMFVKLLIDKGADDNQISNNGGITLLAVLLIAVFFWRRFFGWQKKERGVADLLRKAGVKS